MNRKLFVTILLAVAAPTVSSAQIPEAFTNLEMFEPGITRPQLVGVMRSWASALGVRCSHCHVGPDDLQGMDFATDDKAAKRTARRMYGMARSINRELADGLPTVDQARRVQHVTCYTCHRGLPQPPAETSSRLDELARADGFEAAFAELERLRAEHSESGAYDLSVGVLNRLAQSALERGDLEGALASLERNRELFPEAAVVLVRLAMTLASAGRADEGRENVRRALELAPTDQEVRRVASALGVALPDG